MFNDKRFIIMRPVKLFACIIFLIVSAVYTPVQAQRIGTQFGLAAENPGISVVGTFLSNYSSELKRPGFGISDAEIAFQSPVDPFARFDVLLHYASDRFETGYGHDHEGHEHSSGFEVEEALITLNSLPWYLQVSGGRMRSKIGIVNVVHLHDFNFIRYPQVITRYWGAEGLIADGIRASWLAPLPFWMELIFEGQKTQTGEDHDYGTGSVNLFFPAGENAGLMLTGSGFFDKQTGAHSIMPGFHHDEDDEVSDEALDAFREGIIGERDSELNGFGLGVRYKWQPITQALYRHVIVQGEYMNRKFGDDGYSGFYVMGELKVNPRWTIGVLAEKTDVPYIHEHYQVLKLRTESIDGISAALSYFPSHFQRLRLQFDSLKEVGFTDKAVTLQWTFLIGPHKPHAY